MYAIGQEFTAISPKAGAPGKAKVTGFYFKAGRHEGVYMTFEDGQDRPAAAVVYDRLAKLRAVLAFGRLETGTRFWAEDPDEGWIQWRKVTPFDDPDHDCGCPDDGRLNSEGVDLGFVTHFCESMEVRPALKGVTVK